MTDAHKGHPDGKLESHGSNCDAMPGLGSKQRTDTRKRHQECESES